MNTEDQNSKLEEVYPPFSKDQIRSINEFQECSFWHEMSCGTDNCPGILKAAKNGFECSWCGWQQKYAYKFMADWSWKRIYERHQAWLTNPKD